MLSRENIDLGRAATAITIVCMPLIAFAVAMFFFILSFISFRLHFGVVFSLHFDM